MATPRCMHLLLQWIILLQILGRPLLISGSTLKFKSINCDFANKTKAEFKVCRIDAQTHRTNTISVHLLVKEVVKSITVKVQLFKRASGWKPFMYDLSFDACRFLKAPKQFPIAAWMYGNIAPFTNVNHSCPIDHDIWVKNYTHTEAGLQLPFPYGEYLLDSRWIVNGQMNARFNYSVQFAQY